jgi:hypothetical protein
MSSAGAAYGTSRATASARVAGIDADYRLTETDDGRLTEDGADYRILDEAISAASAGNAAGVGSIAATGASEAAADAVAAGTAVVVAEGARIAIVAASGTATGTSTAAAVSTAEVPPIVVLLPGGGAPRVWERIVRAEGHAIGTSKCRATGRARFAASGQVIGKAETDSFGIARRYLHDDELMILLEAA